MKKVKKFKLNKTVISNLNENEMQSVRGGFTITQNQGQCTVNFCMTSNAGACWGITAGCGTCY